MEMGLCQLAASPGIELPFRVTQDCLKTARFLCYICVLQGWAIVKLLTKRLSRYFHRCP